MVITFGNGKTSYFAILLWTLLRTCDNSSHTFQSVDDRPTIQELQKIPVKDGYKDIVGEIQNDYERLGSLLLNDRNGVEVKGITTAEDNDPVKITTEILRRWLLGKGILPVTWQTLIKCLREAELNTAADYIEAEFSSKGNWVAVDELVCDCFLIFTLLIVLAKYLVITIAWLSFLCQQECSAFCGSLVKLIY